MKKTRFIPMIMIASLAAGCVTAVTANDGVSLSASVKDSVDREGSLFDALLSETGAKDTKIFGIKNPLEKDKGCCDQSSIVSAVANVAVRSEDNAEDAAESDKQSVVDEETDLSGDVAEEASESPEVIPDNGSYSVQTTAYEDNKEDSGNTVGISEAAAELSEVKEVSSDGAKGDTDIRESGESVEENDTHEHEWTPVTKMIHHDAVTHTEEVCVSIYDNNKSFSYEDEEGNTICNVFKHGTIDTYENSELVSSEGAETAGTMEIHNVLTGETYIFAPGELDDYDEFVHDLFDREIYAASALIGPAFGVLEDREVVDAEAYDEEVTECHICEICGEKR